MPTACPTLFSGLTSTLNLLRRARLAEFSRPLKWNIAKLGLLEVFAEDEEDDDDDEEEEEEEDDDDDDDEGSG